ncbi:hypothetical protein FEM03_20715 [Phragmitibacter flavus]|uniref:Uncharacterized protein n=1 Tax=Phragmitibacter flavus TaxID=2576071 RepID=A0A5R8KB42_9BACT|nr:hypothetical protein [Phragmitibacter flavus]TLD68759.1 hypothetical protein FEM03_20715 [Phragmitibacter flavus]
MTSLAHSQSVNLDDPVATVPFKEEKVGDFAASGILGSVKVEGAFSGSLLTVDEAFTTKYENNPPSAPFKVIVPKDKGLRFLPGGKKSGAPELIRITLPDAEEKKAVEILRFGPLRLKQGAAEERVKAAVNLLKKAAFPMFTNGFENARELEVYLTKVGSYDAAVMHIEMSAPAGGPDYLVKAIAILHPTKDGGAMGFLMADKNLSEVKSVEDLSSKGVGMQIIHSLKFVEE